MRPAVHECFLPVHLPKSKKPQSGHRRPRDRIKTVTTQKNQDKRRQAARGIT